MSKIYTPWTEEQVAALTKWQTTIHVHPFTCQFHSYIALVPTKDGLHCPAKNCRYLQFWVWDFMMEPVPPPPFKFPNKNEMKEEEKSDGTK